MRFPLNSKLTMLMVLASALAVSVTVNAEPVQEKPAPIAETQAEKVDTASQWQQARADQNPIQRVLTAGLMNGYPDGKFHPEGHVTRAELAHILVKTFKVDVRQPQNFDKSNMADVPEGHWAYNDIATALKANVMEGYRPGQFYPNQAVTRAEAFAIFAQAYGVFNFDDQQVQSTLGEYKDAKDIPSWATKAMVTALHEGFVNTNELSAHIYPNKPMTRGDMAYALNQYLKRTYSEFPAKSDSNVKSEAQPAK